MKYLEDFTIVSKETLETHNYILNIKRNTSLPEIKAGQFVNILVKNIPNKILRRPISVFDVDYNNNIISLLIQEVGISTKKLYNYNINTQVSVIFPLGNSFPMTYKKPLLIGGGVGIAPLYLLAKQYKEKDIKPTIIYGARNKKLILIADKLSLFSNLYISTETGDIGDKGFVSENSALNKDDYDCIMTCGPNIMMQAVNEIAKKKNIPCYVSLENHMACGVGACLCCVVDTKKGNICTCTEGPVFLANDLKNW